MYDMALMLCYTSILLFFIINTTCLVLAFIGATRALLIIESGLYLGIGIHVYCIVYKEHYFRLAAVILTFLIGNLIFFHLLTFLYYDFGIKGMVMVVNTSFNNIPVIQWRSVVLVEETGVLGENYRPAVRH